MDCKGFLDQAIYSVRGGQGMVWPGIHIDKERANLQKGRYAGSQRRTVIGLGSSTGPHTKEVWTGKYARSCIKALISYGYK
jgi:hypothetical protein